MKAFGALLRRELWEHPSLYIAPVLVGGIAALSVVLVLARTSPLWGDMVLTIDDQSGLGRDGFTATLTSLLLPLFAVTVALTVIFYLLDSLYGERRDRSVLFFRSLPVGDLATVVSKLTTGVVVAPLIGCTVLVATELSILLAATAIGLLQGSSAGVLWDFPALAVSWLTALCVAVVVPLWYAPFAGYLLAVSAWARRGVLLWACAPLLLVQLEFLVTGKSVLGRIIAGRIMALFSARLSDAAGQVLRPEGASGAMAAITIDFSAFDAPWVLVARPAFWSGLAVAALFVVGAMLLRRFRDLT